MTDLSITQKALYTIKKLKQQLNEQKQLNIREPIAIIGMSCRFPTVNNKDEYWQLLTNANNVIRQLPEERWQLLKNTQEMYQRDANHPYWGGYLPAEVLTGFDAYFFGISPREAICMDPQQRLLLEVAYEAFCDAGLTRTQLAGSNTGIFASLYASQFLQLLQLKNDLDALFIPTGNAASIAANRLSYVFDLRGPSIVVDTACSSSLVALHLACQNLQNKTCEIALVAGVHINLLPSINLLLAKAKMLSPDGQCKTFDATANGYVPGEGAGVVILKPLTKAIADKNRIYAVIAGSDVNQDGKTNGLTAPNGLVQEMLIQQTYTKASIDANNLAYIECHGTGTLLGDPIEVQALGNALNAQRNSANNCWIGSVKTNLGHLEPAAGIAGVIKTALALLHGQIPAHINFSIPNPHIDFDQYNFSVPQKLQAWPAYSNPRMASVSGFGFGGTNAHVVLRETLATEKFELITDAPCWQHKHYWPTFVTQLMVESIISEEHIFCGKQIVSPLNNCQFEFSFSVKDFPEVKDTYSILHLGYYLEMLGFFVQKTHPKTVFEISTIKFLLPIVVPQESNLKVQLILELRENNIYDFCFYSQPGDKNIAWNKHAHGKLRVVDTTENKLDNISAIKQRCLPLSIGDQFYDRMTTMGMPSAGSICWINKYGLNANEVWCELQSPDLVVKNDQFSLNFHPGLMDACVQSAFALLPSHICNAYVASRIEKLTCFNLQIMPRYLWGQLKKLSSTNDVVECDWYLLAEDGTVIMHCEQISLTQISKQVNTSNVIRNKEQFTFDLAGLDSQKAEQQLTEYLIAQIAIILAMPKSDVSSHIVLQEMGFDSLMGLALVSAIESDLKVVCSLQPILQGITINDLVQYILLDCQKRPSIQTVSQVKPKIQNKSSWFAHRRVNPNAKMRLFCFPYGGGGASIYRDWQHVLPDFIEICPIQLPGREERMDEKPVAEIQQLIDVLIENLQSHFDLPFAFFGHSFGALVAFELARQLRQRAAELPKHLFVSAYPDPCTPTRSLDNLVKAINTLNIDLFSLCSSAAINNLDDEQLSKLAEIFNESGLIMYGGYMTNQEIIKLLLPIFIADMSIVRSYRYIEAAPLDLPITVFLGKKDTWVTYEDHLGWNQHTESGCTMHKFEGGHLFIKEEPHKSEVLKKIAETLRSVAHA